MQATPSSGNQLVPAGNSMPAVKRSVMYYFAVGAGYGLKNAVVSLKYYINGYLWGFESEDSEIALVSCAIIAFEVGIITGLMGAGEFTIGYMFEAFVFVMILQMSADRPKDEKYKSYSLLGLLCHLPRCIYSLAAYKFAQLVENGKHLSIGEK